MSQNLTCNFMLVFVSCLYDGLLITTGKVLTHVYMMVYSILQARRCLYDGLLNTTD
jgi:hypothetical protein